MGSPSLRSMIVLTIVFTIALGPLYQLDFFPSANQKVTGPVPESIQTTQISGQGPTDPTMISQLFSSDCFIENMGQAGEGGGRYYTEGNPLSVAFDRGWISYWWSGGDAETGEVLIRIWFEGSNDVEPRGLDLIDGNRNYLIGNDLDGWRTGVRSYSGIIYHDLWDDIDLLYRITDSGLKYELIVHRGGDPWDISFRVEGHDRLSIGSADTMVISQGTVDITDDDLQAYYSGDHGEQVDVAFQVKGKDLFGFNVGEYDGMREIVIDPIIYSTLINGGHHDNVNDLVVDDEGHAFVTGRTYSKNSPSHLEQ